MILTGRESHPVLQTLRPEVEQELLKLDKTKVEEYYQVRAEAMRMEKADPFRYGYEPPIWKKADEQLAELRKSYPVGVVEELDLGGNRGCLVKGSLIFDAAFGKEMPIEEQVENPFSLSILAWNGSSLIPAGRQNSFSKGELECVSVKLNTGREFSCSLAHRVLGLDGRWRMAGELFKGSPLVGGAKVELVTEIGLHECFDFHVPGFENYQHAGVVHHNSKSERAAKRLVQILVEKPGAKVWFLQSTQTISRQSQQNLVWKYLPIEWKPVSGRGKRDIIQKMNYTQAGGFTEDTFVLPNGSQGWFKFYSVQVTSVEGPELDAAWSDELVTPEWLEFLRYRLVTRNGYLLTTFTPVEGYSATVKTYLDRAKTLEAADAELLPNRNASGEIVSYEKVPRIQQSGIERARIVYFHTSDNPYGNYPSMKETLRGKSRETVLMRAYGVPSKTFGAALPMFRENVHVISVNRFERWQKECPNMTRYHLVDPCSGRNWFMLWVACTPEGKKIVYREWPSFGHEKAYIPGIGDPDEWTTTGEPADGIRGPAQKAFGFGLERYVEEIRRLEGKEQIVERWIDARSGNMPTATREGTTTLIEQLAELDMDFRASASEKSIFGNNDGSLDMLNSALYYDADVPLGEFSKSLARINEPELLVVETCPNVIYSMSNWTGKDGQQGACKDPIDCLRSLVLNELDFENEDSMRPHSPWAAALGR